jgi:PAS domain S-box-containing protein
MSHTATSGDWDGRPDIGAATSALASPALREALLKSSTLQTLIDALPSIVVFTDVDGRIERVNDMARMTLGVDEESLVGRLVTELGLRDDDPLLRACGRAPDVIAHGETHRELLETGDEDGGNAYLLLSVPIKDDGGAVVGLAQNVVDLSPIVATQRANQVLSARLSQSERLESLGRLAGGISHDFNNLLSVIINFAAFVRLELGDEHPLSADVDQIQAAAERASALTAQLLIFGRRDVTRREPVSVSEIVAEMSGILRRSVGERIELRAETDTGPGGDIVEIDRGQLEQALLNLVVNARDAMVTGGEIVVHVAPVRLDPEQAAARGLIGGDHVRITVRDTGIGMDEATAVRALEPFFTTKEDGGGAGLGLATAYGTVQQSGGTIEIVSRPGQGTAVRVYLPRVDTSRKAEAAPEALDVTPTPAGKGERVLVVEDVPEVRITMERILRDGGYEPVVAEGPEEAMLRARMGPIDLVLSDVGLPGLGGPALVERLIAEHGPMRVVFTSGYPDDAELVQRARDGDVPFLPKPFGRDALLTAVRDAIDGSTQ